MTKYRVDTAKDAGKANLQVAAVAATGKIQSQAKNRPTRKVFRGKRRISDLQRRKELVLCNIFGGKPRINGRFLILFRHKGNQIPVDIFPKKGCARRMGVV